MRNEHLQVTVIRRVQIRENLKPIKAYWCSGPAEPDWAAIALVTGANGYESFDLLLLKIMPPSRAVSGCASPSPSVRRFASISYDTLPIAKGQAHADLGIEYVEWEPCHVDITKDDCRLSWERILPVAEPGDDGAEEHNLYK